MLDGCEALGLERLDCLGDLVTELERNFRLTDQVLKFMSILLDKDVDPEEVKRQESENIEKASKELETEVQEDEAEATEEDVNEDDSSEE